MQRCLQLAALGVSAAPNPKVGAVLVYNDIIIGEGYHEQYGKAHAEVNCINSVPVTDKKYIPGSTLYVSLEPCAHFGKTPPCTDLIIENKIPVVVIGCKDNFNKVNGQGIEKLKNAGVRVVENILSRQAVELNKFFFTFNSKKRPYIILKWAQSKDGKIAGKDFLPLKISNEFTDVLVHKWRSEAGSILIGRRTALYDDPALTTRMWKGKSPVRLIIDKNLSLPGNLKLFNQENNTIVFNYKKNLAAGKIQYQMLKENDSVLLSIMDYLFQKNIQSVLVEGGAATLQLFIDAGLWDEARVITSNTRIVQEGLKAPVLKEFEAVKTENIYSDDIRYYINRQSNN